MIRKCSEDALLLDSVHTLDTVKRTLDKVYENLSDALAATDEEIERVERLRDRIAALLPEDVE